MVRLMCPETTRSDKEDLLGKDRKFCLGAR